MESPRRIVQIADLSAPELQPYRTLRRPVEHHQKRIFVAEGEKVVTRMLEAGWPVVSMLMTNEWLAHFDLADSHFVKNLENQGTIYIGPKSLLETIVGYRLHQGIMAVGRIPVEPPTHEWVMSLPENHLLIAMDGIVHAENVGVIVRNCCGFGAHAVIAGEKSASPYLRRAVRNSMGGVFRINLHHPDNLADCLRACVELRGTRILAADPSGQKSVYDADFRGNICVILGNEGQGISPRVLELSETRVSIPMANRIDSLNVSNACAVVLYEAVRKRTSGKNA